MIMDSLQNILQPIIVDYALWLLLPIAGWFVRRLPERWRVDIEARHREALHRALDTAVGLIIDTAQRHPGLAIPDAVISRGIGYVAGSVPDAIKRLGPTPESLELMMRSKLQRALDEATGRDRLTEALQKAGLPA